MRDFSDVFPKQPGAAGRFGRGWPSVRRPARSELAVGLIIGLAIFATAAGSLSMEGAKASQPPATSGASRLVETAFASLSVTPAAAGAPARARNSACIDVTYFFLHKSCTTPRKRHFGRLHRPRTPRPAVLARNP